MGYTVQKPGCNNMIGQYDAEFIHDDGSKSYIVYPKITKEENQKRWDATCEVASRLIDKLISQGVDLSVLID